jgi:hypothetical protein
MKINNVMDMKIEEIITKSELSQEEMEFVVEEYIFEKKNRRVKINIMANPVLQLVPTNMQTPLIQRELGLLNEAYQMACEYFFEKDAK